VVGGIIGKSGTKVKEIRDNSGTQIKVRFLQPYILVAEGVA
jgi:hypothetical protein